MEYFYSMNAYKTASNVGIVIAFFGLAIMFYGFRFLLERNDLQKNGIQVKGKVIEIAQNGPMYRMPVVEFKTLEGKYHRFESRLQINHLMFKYFVGQEVTVIYHKNNFRNSEIDAFWEQNFPQIFLGCFGILVLIIGIFIRWFLLRKSRFYSKQ
jgi:hypothetical protein